MFRTATVCLLACVLAVGGCKKKDEAPPQEQGSSSGTPATTTAAPAAAGKAVDWAKIERVPFAKLQTLLPETLPNGLKRTDLRGSTTPDAEHTFTEAAADYEGPKDAHMTVTIHDNPLDAQSRISSKTTSFKGYPVVGESEGGGASDLTFVVGDRFVVTAHGNEVKVADLKTALEKVDLAKLATWKDQSLKK